MRSPLSRPRLHPIMIPELAYSPLSPSDSVFSSPAESEVIHTPCFEHCDDINYDPHPEKNVLDHPRPHLQEECIIKLSQSSVQTPPCVPRLFLHSSTSAGGSIVDESAPPSPAGVAAASPMEINSFAVSFAMGFNSEPHSNKPQLSPPSRAISNHHSPGPYMTIPMNSPTNKIMPFNTRACLHSPRFAVGHRLNMHFVRAYELNDELGSGGYGFVMTARNRVDGCEVAVKFIIKDKVPEHAWMEDETLGRLPTEVMLLSFIDHENIVKCLDLFEDDLYFYLVQELHGTPWENAEEDGPSSLSALSSPSLGASTPALSPSVSVGSMADSVPGTPLCSLSHSAEHPGSEKTFGDASSALVIPGLLDPASIRPPFARRPSHDLFECIEQSEHKRLPEDQARYVFAQVVDAVHYLDSLGVTHRDIKDENLVIDKHLKVKLIDFGSAVVVDPTKPRPYHTLFYGTTAYASSEILLKKKYQAPPAEIWTLGVLLSYLLTGSSPFPTVKDAIDGRIALPESAVSRFSKEAMEVMRRCLDSNPLTRATIAEVRSHQWLTGAGAIL